MTPTRMRLPQLTGFGLALCLTLLEANAGAVEPRPGQIYPGGTTLSLSSLGLSLSIPTAWRGALSPDGEALQMEPTAGGAMLLAYADHLSPEDTYTTLQGPIPLDSGLTLQLNGKITRRGSELSAQYSIPLQPSLHSLGQAVSNANGTSVALFLIAPATNIDAYRSALQAAFNSINFHPLPSATPTSDTAKQNSGRDLWSDYLKGKHIVRFFTASGYSEEQHIWLCSDGGYYRSFDGGGWGGGASGAFQSQYAGKWQATGAGEHGQLQLQDNSGKVSTYQLRWDFKQNRLYVDGKRWLHDKNGACR